MFDFTYPFSMSRSLGDESKFSSAVFLSIFASPRIVPLICLHEHDREKASPRCVPVVLVAGICFGMADRGSIVLSFSLWLESSYHFLA